MMAAESMTETMCMTDGEREARLAELERRIAELRARLPRHTPSARMLVELDELEDELQRMHEQVVTGSS